MNDTPRTLVLNSSYRPLSIFPLYVIPADEAIHRALRGNCTVVEEHDRKILTPSRDDLYWPSVIANHNSHSFKEEIRLKKESLFYRDHCVCAYCGDPLTLSTITYDHIYPVSKGGEHVFENVVSACRRCNNLKSDDVSSRWVPRVKPYKPTFSQLLKIRMEYPLIIDDVRWLKYIPRWKGDVVLKGHGKIDVDSALLEYG